MHPLQERLTKESVVEDHLVNAVKTLKGATIKIRFMRGWPDRVVLLPGGVVVFIELKRPVGGKFEPLQLRVHEKLRRMGFTVFVCNTKASINNALEESCSKLT